LDHAVPRVFMHRTALGSSLKEHLCYHILQNSYIEQHVSFIAVLRTAGITVRSGGCRLAVR